MKYAVSFILVLFSSCKSISKATGQGDFPTGKYQVVKLNNEMYKPYKDYILNVSSDENSINGTFDCNTFTIDFERNGNVVKFGYGMATKMYCDGKMHNESAFFKSTQNMTSYSYSKGELVFYNMDKEVILELKLVESE